MEGNPIRPRARRREDREAEKREKLQTVSTAAPRKFTLDDPQPQPDRGGSAPRPARDTQGQGAPGGRDRDRGSDRGGRPGGAQGTPNGSGRGGRRVITLERPRNEHLRPVNITVQRMYFGDWTVENMPPDEGGHGEGGRSGGRRFGQDGRGGDRGGRGPAYSRGGSDRGAVRDLNGRSGGSSRGAAPRVGQPQTQPQQADAGDANRRRRRRGRRGGNGPQG